MSWFTRRFDKWASDTQHKEMSTFVESLKVMDSDEIGFLLASATHVRHALESMGHDVMHPVQYVSANPMFPLTVSQTIQDCQKEEKLPQAAAMMVWLHTARGAVRLELRGLAREMWGQLARGFDYVEQQAETFAQTTGARLDTRDAQEFPDGFTPEPL
jgi:hypothetical protein